MQGSDVLGFIEQNDVKFIRLAFVDLFGRPKNVAVLPERLPQALEAGVPLDATALAGFESASGGDLLLTPDPDTLCILPWRPTSGRVCHLLCDLRERGGAPYVADPRALLRQAVARATARGMDVRVALECEFYLFEADAHGGITRIPHDRAGYLDVAPLDRGEDVRRDLCLMLEGMNIRPASSRHGRGPGQTEIGFHRADPLAAADRLVAFQGAVRTVAGQYGLRASFLPKPPVDGVGSGLRIGMALYREQRNLFQPDKGKLGAEAQSALAGVLRRLPDMTLLLNPLPNSYDRLADAGAPNRVAWSFARDDSAARLPVPQDRFACMQLCSPDPACNLYLALALLIDAALDGMASEAKLPRPRRAGDASPLLPDSLQVALDLASESAFLASALPRPVIDAYRARAQSLQQRHLQDTTGLLDSQFQVF